MRQRQPTRLSDEDRRAILEELNRGPFPYGVTIVADWEVDDIVRDALRAQYDFVVVDLLHGFHYEDERGLDRLSKAMQRLARVSTTIDGHPGTAVIAVTHLKEEGTVRGKIPRPTIASIKGGSSIKQDADCVLFVWQEQDDAANPTGDGEIWLAKGRSMELTRVKVRLNPARFRFELRPDEADSASVAVPQEAVPF
jgi:replicative DNA helicase